MYMDVIIFIQTIIIYCLDIEIEFGIEKYTTFIVKTRNNGRNAATKSEKHQNAWRNRK